jgi:3-hydroxyisobutyrate dehydrogenase-like beta-hydroxyacid dehydrogenase
VLTGLYAAGFTNTLMAKDLSLYLREVEAQGGPARLGALTAAVWGRFSEAEPGADFTRIYPFIETGGGPAAGDDAANGGEGAG